jgi:NitT/TauT family transport system permease protein
MSATMTTAPTGTSTPAATEARRSRRGLRGRPMAALKSIGYLIAAVVLGIAIWELVILIANPPRYILPTPLAVWRTLIDLVKTDPGSPSGLWQQLWATVEGTLIGFVIGCVAGVILGILAGEFEVVRRLVYPYLVAIQSLPKVALVPLLATWFGFGLTSKVALVILLVFFPVLVNTFQGIASADPERIDLVRSLKAGRWQQLVRVRFFSAMPYMFTGFELGIVYAFLGAVLAEMTGSQNGIGVMVQQFQINADTQASFAILIVLAIVGLILNSLVRWLHRKVVFWEVQAGRAIRITTN